jgi:hypothetical protein
MNKRIFELADEAGFYVRHTKGEILPPTISEDITQWQIKFAELIIKECVAQCWSVSETEFEGADISECVKRIKSHFGVK